MTGILTLPLRVSAFAVWFAGQVLISAWKVLSDILTPGLHNTPRVVSMPLESRSDFHVAIIGMLITLTPGTLTLGITSREDGGRSFLVHAMYHDDYASALSSLREMERRMLRALTVGGSR